MAAVSGDRRFEAAQNDIKERKVTKMEEWLTRALDNATEQGIAQGVTQRDRELILKWTRAGYKALEIAELLGYSEEEVRKVQAEK